MLGVAAQPGSARGRRDERHCQSNLVACAELLPGPQSVRRRDWGDEALACAVRRGATAARCERVSNTVCGRLV